MPTSLAANLIDRILVTETGCGLADTLTHLRAKGTSWDAIPAELMRLLGDERFTISRETVRRWAAELGAPESVA